MCIPLFQKIRNIFQRNIFQRNIFQRNSINPCENEFKKYLDENDYYNIIVLLNTHNKIDNKIYNKIYNKISKVDGISPIMYYYNKHLQNINYNDHNSKNYSTEYDIINKLLDIYKNDISVDEIEKINVFILYSLL